MAASVDANRPPAAVVAATSGSGGGGSGGGLFDGVRLLRRGGNNRTSAPSSRTTVRRHRYASELLEIYLPFFFGLSTVLKFLSSSLSSPTLPLLSRKKHSSPL